MRCSLGVSISAPFPTPRTAGVSKLNLLVNNAGVMHDGWSRENWERHWTTNVAGQARLIRESPGIHRHICFDFVWAVPNWGPVKGLVTVRVLLAV